MACTQIINYLDSRGTGDEWDIPEKCLMKLVLLNIFKVNGKNGTRAVSHPTWTFLSCNNNGPQKKPFNYILNPLSTPIWTSHFEGSNGYWQSVFQNSHTETVCLLFYHCVLGRQMVRLLPWVGSFIGSTKTCSSVHLQQYRWNKGAFFSSRRVSTLLLLQQFCLQSDFCCLNKQVLFLAHWLNLSFLGSRWHHLYRKMYDFFPTSLQCLWDACEQAESSIEKTAERFLQHRWSAPGSEGVYLDPFWWQTSAVGKLLLAVAFTQLKGWLRCPKKGQFSPLMNNSNLCYNK